MRAAKLLLLFATACCGVAGCASGPEALPYRVRNDEIPEPLTEVPGDASQGREIVMGRDGNCLLCHAIPETGQRFMGNVAPPLSNVATRLTPGQIRLRIVDPTRLNPDAVMPAYYRIEGLDRVAPPFQGQPILSAQQVEDVVAYLSTLK
jgi:sulfur-oxidizing protein SoxX